MREDDKISSNFANGWPQLSFDVPAGSKLSISSAQTSGWKNHFSIERRPQNAAAAYQDFREYVAGMGEIINSENLNYSYNIQGWYYGDFGISSGPSQIKSTTISTDKRHIEIVFSRSNGEPISRVVLAIG